MYSRTGRIPERRCSISGYRRGRCTRRTVEGIETDLVADTDDDGDDWSDEDEALCGTSSVDALSTPIDVDGDGTCDTIDTDDDGDDWSDEDEALCGTNSKEGTSIPFDGDDDGICDALDTKTLGYSNNGTTGDVFEAVLNQSDFIIVPSLSGMEPGTWSIFPALPAGLEFNGTMSRSGESGIISGTPTETSPMTEYTVFANNSQTGVQFTFSMAILADTDNDGLPDGPSATGLEVDQDDDGDGVLDAVSYTHLTLPTKA